jgi:hypothetical protein
MEPGAAAALLEDVADRALRSEFKPDDGAEAGVVAEAVGDQSAQRPVITRSGDVMKVMMHFHNQRMRRLTAAGLLPERAGQPVKAWAHISLADLLLLDADSALQQEWTERVRARWAARRAHAAEAGASDGPWLDGDAAAALACDAAMAPVVTGDINIDALDDLVRLCVELDRLRRDGHGPDTPAAGTTAAWAAIEQAVIGKAVDLLSGRGGWRRSCGGGSWGCGWAGRACRWISGTPRRSRRGSATRCCCGTGTASGPAAAPSPPAPARSTTPRTRPTAAPPP